MKLILMQMKIVSKQVGFKYKLITFLIENIIEVPFSDKAQYYSILAYIFEEYAPEKLDLIFNLYFMSCFRDKNNFPKVSFF